MSKPSLSITLRTDLPAHPLDKQIRDLALELRQLVRQRASYFMSKAHRGRVRSVAERKRMSDAQRGRKVSAETCAKLSKSLKGRKLTPAHKANMAAGKRRKKLRDPLETAIFGGTS